MTEKMSFCLLIGERQYKQVTCIKHVPNYKSMSNFPKGIDHVLERTRKEVGFGGRGGMQSLESLLILINLVKFKEISIIYYHCSLDAETLNP